MRTRSCLLAAIAVGLIGSGPAWAQGNPSLAGTWTRDAGAGGGRGVRGIPIATELVIRVSPAEVTVDSDTGSARSTQTALYKLDGSETSVPGPLGWETKAKARWDGDKLVVTTRRSIEGPNGPVGVDVSDVYIVAGDRLTIERTQGRNSDTLVYTRTR